MTGLTTATLAAKMRKHARRLANAKSKASHDRKLAAENARIRREAFARDNERCRAFGFALRLTTSDPALLAHCHHFVYRSAGGVDDLHNRITLSPLAHALEHEHALEISGEPMGELTFTFGKDQWTSTVGQRVVPPMRVRIRVAVLLGNFVDGRALSCPPQTVGREATSK